MGELANQKALRIKNAFEEKGCHFFTNSTTNQQFPILPNHWIEELFNDFEFYVWEKFDENNAVIRMITSWATPDEAIESLIQKIGTLSK